MGILRICQAAPHLDFSSLLNQEAISEGSAHKFFLNDWNVLGTWLCFLRCG